MTKKADLLALRRGGSDTVSSAGKLMDVFLSYARPTASTARAITDGLRAAGRSVWLDDELSSHRAYADEIAEQLDAAAAVIVIWSEAAVGSQWVRSEADRARRKGTLAQLRIDNASLPMPFDQIQCLDLGGWTGERSAPAWLKLLDNVALLVSGTPKPTSRASEPALPSIAVMPFRDLSPARDQDYFCEGMAEEILGALARLPGLRVAASAAASRLGGVETARALNVGAFLEGSVRKTGQRARIGVRLVETADGFTLWADSFDRELSDIFAVQDEIARAIVAALGVRLLARDEARLGLGGTADPKAHDLYLRARQLVRRELEAEARAAAELFRDATRQDPSFALAFAGLSDILSQIARVKLTGWKEAEQEAIAAAEQAIAIAPQLAEAHLALGEAFHLRRDPRAPAAFEKAVALSPDDANVHYRFAHFLVLQGDKAGAIVHYERAFALAPDDYRSIVLALQEYQALGDKAGERSCLLRSAEAIERHLALDPDDAYAYSHGAGVQAQLGNSHLLERYIARALALRPDDYTNLVNLACAAMLNHDADRALDLLEQAVATGRGDRIWTLADNDLKPLHDHPRFKALVERMA